MSNPDDGLDVLLQSVAIIERDTAETERIYSAAWSRVRAIGALQQRRPELFADRAASARRRRRNGGGCGCLSATHTGQQSSGWERAAFGSGEWLDLGGEDNQQVMAQETADIPFAPGHEGQHARSLASLRGETNERISESMARALVARDAICTWADQWVVADDAGNSAARAEAADTLTASVSWSAVRAMDPDPDPAEATSHLGWVPPIAEAARAGDRSALLAAMSQSGRSDTMMPAVLAASDYAGPR